jgi:hypothetical protein
LTAAATENDKSRMNLFGPPFERLLFARTVDSSRRGRIRPCSFVFPRGVIHPFEPDQVSRFDPPTFELGAVGHVANSNLGNGNLRPETFGKTRQELPLRIAGPLLRPVLGEASY